MPNLNLTFKSDLHFIVFRTGQRANFNANDLRVLIVGEIYSLDTVETQVPLCYHSVPHALTDNHLATTLVPFSFFFAISITKKYT